MLGCLFSPVLSLIGFFQADPWRGQCTLLKSRVMIPPLSVLNSTTSWSLHLRLLSTWLVLPCLSELQQNVSFHRTLVHLRQEIISVLQKPSGLLLCCTSSRHWGLWISPWGPKPIILQTQLQRHRKILQPENITKIPKLNLLQNAFNLLDNLNHFLWMPISHLTIIIPVMKILLSEIYIYIFSSWLRIGYFFFFSCVKLALRGSYGLLSP